MLNLVREIFLNLRENCACRQNELKDERMGSADKIFSLSAVN